MPTTIAVAAPPTVSSLSPAPPRREPTRRINSLPPQRHRQQRAVPAPSRRRPTQGRSRRVSAYSCFYSQNNPRFQEEARKHPDFLNGGASCRTVAMRLMGEEWKALEDTSEWVQKADEINQQRQTELEGQEGGEEDGEGAGEGEGEEAAVGVCGVRAARRGIHKQRGGKRGRPSSRY